MNNIKFNKKGWMVFGIGQLVVTSTVWIVKWMAAQVELQKDVQEGLKLLCTVSYKTRRISV